MIIIFGGTTEGRTAAQVLDEAGSPYYYSTRGNAQQIECKHGTRVTGGMDRNAMLEFCMTHNIRLIIDAAHPFASLLHATVASVSEQLDIPSSVLNAATRRETNRSCGATPSTTLSITSNHMK